MSFEAEKNPYYEETVNTFRECFSKKQIMEVDFRPNMIQEYAELSKELIKAAVELLKLGVSRKLDGDTVIFYIDNKDYYLPKKDILKEIGEKQWNVFFPIEELERVRGKEEDEETENIPQGDYGYDSSKNVFTPVNPMANPFGALLTSIFAPFMGMQGYNQPIYQTPSQSVPVREEKSTNTSDILDDISGLHRKIVLLEKERDSAQDSIALVKQKYEELKKDATEKKAQYEKESSESESKIKELTEKVETLEGDIKALKDAGEKTEYGNRNTILQLQAKRDTLFSELNETRNKLDNSKKEKDALDKQLQELRLQMENTKTEYTKIISDKDKVISDLKSKTTELERNLAENKERFSRDNKKNEEMQGRIKNLTSEKDTLKNDIEKLNKEIESSRKEKEQLEDKVSSLNDKLSEKDELLEEIKRKHEEMEHLAYTDIKTGTMNLNAFNRDFAKCDKNNTVIAMVGIRNMKSINSMHGRMSGDNVIGMVTERLISMYQKTNVYRILGDQFVIIIRGGMASNVHNQLSSIQQGLLSSNIEIAFGVSSGNMANDLGHLLSIAEEGMNQMKQNGGGFSQNVNNTPVQQPSVNQAPANTGYQMPPSSEEMNTPKEQYSSPQEMNIDNMLLEYMNAQN